ncbi:MAG: flagellar biosynthesis regulatory protein FlaF [Acidimicrobiales bacterium]|nr:flagellar biosynthesis regulator FlaF [Hyphomonadaceae bacterium]RZV44770.1 MAG: flagellar biosynthesis regulatory protein FlaF [Acidimicrobiales bacterium]
MTAQQIAHKKYLNSQRELASDKAVELRVFASITSKMRAADTNEIGGMSKLAEALYDNVKLWNLLLIDLTNPENPLPLDLKTSIISLSEFTQKHTVKVMAGRATHDVLIDINQAMIDGLRQSRSIQAMANNQTHEQEIEAA